MKSVTVREFEPITCNPDYQQEYPYLPEKAFRALEEFIRSYEASDGEADILRFLKLSYRRHLGDTITVSNFVGVIQVDSCTQLEILPKISLAEERGNLRKTKRIFCQMLRALKEFEGQALSLANLATGSMNLYEVFIQMYLSEVRYLVRQGLQSRYMPVEKNMRCFKGRLRVAEQTRVNLAHQERFFMAFDEYSLNRPVNRIIKATLQKLRRISSSEKNIREIGRLLGAFSEIDASVYLERDFSRIKMDRTMISYGHLVEWSRVFLKGESFTAFSGNTNARAILFPMEKVFEAYVAKRMKALYEPSGWQVSAQDQGKYLFDTPKRFHLRPDVVVTRNDGSKVILDTKWKRLTSEVRSNYGISQADMYQMYAYAHKYGECGVKLPDVWVLYPLNDEMRNQKPLSFESEDGVHIHIDFIDLEHADASLMALKEKLAE